MHLGVLMGSVGKGLIYVYTRERMSFNYNTFYVQYMFMD